MTGKQYFHYFNNNKFISGVTDRWMKFATLPFCDFIYPANTKLQSTNMKKHQIWGLTVQYKRTVCKDDFVYCLNHLNLGHVLELGSEFSIFFFFHFCLLTLSFSFLSLILLTPQSLIYNTVSTLSYILFIYHPE